MLGIGFTEMLVIAAIALIAIGPEKFPDFAKVALRTVRDLRGYMDEMREEINKEIRPVEREVKSLKRYDPEQYIDHFTGKGGEDEEERRDDTNPYAKSEGTEIEGAEEDDKYGNVDEDAMAEEATETLDEARREANPPEGTESYNPEPDADAVDEFIEPDKLD